MASVWLTALLLVQLSLLCFTNVLAENIEAVLPPIPPHNKPYYHHPAMAPSHPPSHHHHHHNHPPSPAPGHHHHHHGHPPSHAPMHAPVHPPMPHVPVHPPVHSIPPPKPTPTPVPPPVHSKPPPKPAPTPVPPPAHPPSYRPPRSFVAVQGVVYCKSCNYTGKDTLLGATPLLGATVKLQCNNTKYPKEVKVTTDKNGYFFVEAPKTVTNYGAHKCKVFLVPAPKSPCGKPSNLHGGITGAILRPQKPYMSNKLPFILFAVGPLAYEPTCKHY